MSKTVFFGLITPVTVLEILLCIVICVGLCRFLKAIAERQQQPKHERIVLEVERKGNGWKYYPQDKQRIVINKNFRR